jgi:hypothetical protein
MPNPTQAPSSTTQIRTVPTDRAGVRLREAASRIVAVRFFEGRLVAVPIQHPSRLHPR